MSPPMAGGCRRGRRVASCNLVPCVMLRQPSRPRAPTARADRGRRAARAADAPDRSPPVRESARLTPVSHVKGGDSQSAGACQSPCDRPSGRGRTDSDIGYHAL